MNRLGDYVGQTITTCGLVVEQTHHQITGETCGQFLIYTDDPNAKPQECKGRKPSTRQKSFA